MSIIRSLKNRMITNPKDAFIGCWNYIRNEGENKYRRKSKHYSDSWLVVPPEYLLRRMEEEFYEFRQAVEHNGTIESALEELQDLNNFALMFLIRAYQEGCKQKEAKE